MTPEKKKYASTPYKVKKIVSIVIFLLYIIWFNFNFSLEIIEQYI